MTQPPPRKQTPEELAERDRLEAEWRLKWQREMAEKRAWLEAQSVVKIVRNPPSLWQRMREIFRAIKQG